MMLDAWRDRARREREWEYDLFRMHARLWGVEVPAARDRTETAQEKYDRLTRLGGRVVEVH